MQDAGAIRIGVDLADGMVCAATIRSSRPTALGRLFEGRLAEQAPELAARLFTLCSRAQGAAAAAAVRAARGETPARATRRGEALGVGAEAAFESLRALAMGWPGAASSEVATSLREARRAADALAAAPSQAALAALTGAAERLGFAREPAPESFYGRLRADCAKAPALAQSTPDALEAADDAAAAQALSRDPGFAEAPTLPSRRPETGPFARVWREVAEGAGALAARAEARGLDLLAGLDSLARLLRGDAAEAAQGTTGPGEGYGAVECARGRLLHWCRINGAGRIAAYAILAPTEWNFHPQGPLAAELIGARFGKPEAARATVTKLAALVDPCTGFEVEVREATCTRWR